MVDEAVKFAQKFRKIDSIRLAFDAFLCLSFLKQLSFLFILNVTAEVEKLNQFYFEETVSV